ncbi:MAG: ABC transporter permease [Phycisphaerales bacterium]|nr:MAG: ABC transporter permease [Phycisphaerales bacterium]
MGPHHNRHTSRNNENFHNFVDIEDSDRYIPVENDRQSDQRRESTRGFGLLSRIGARTVRGLTALGRLSTFAWHMTLWLVPGLVRWRTWRLVLPQLYEVGNRTLPVIAVTGTFVGLVLAIQSYDQLRNAGFEERMGVLLTITLVQELGPVLAGVMLAGRVGGALTAELGTMRITEQINALRVMGSDPIRQLVMPRFLACMLFAPLLGLYCDLFGSLSGWFVAVQLKAIPSTPYWFYIKHSLTWWDIMVGLVKSVVFGGLIGLIACYKGFHCRTGAEGVGRACTESFVSSFLAILITDFFIGTFFSGLYKGIYGFKPLL